jgi:DNA-binding winged helix-turn-helix (wHTH) protein
VLYRFEKYVLDTDRRELRQGDELVPLAPQVFDILVYLIHHRDRVVSKEDLLTAIWGGRIVSETALTTRLNGARKAIGDTGE